MARVPDEITDYYDKLRGLDQSGMGRPKRNEELKAPRQFC